MKSLRTLMIAAVIAASFAAVALAQAPQKKSALTAEQESALKAATKTIAAFGKDPTLIAEVRARNAHPYSEAEIQRIDKEWMQASDHPTQKESDSLSGLIRSLQTNRCALQLKKLVEVNRAFGESFVMDDKGANVCMTDRTSDFWQGDEAKWQKSFNGGNGQTFVDKPAYDTSTKQILVQISVPVIDGGKTIGAITVGVSPSLLGAK